MIQTVKVPSAAVRGLTAEVFENDGTERVVIALHGFAMPAVALCGTLAGSALTDAIEGKFALVCPEAKTLMPLQFAEGLVPRYETGNLSAIIPDSLAFARNRWPAATKFYLAGHSYGGRGVILAGFDRSEFDAFAMIAPFAEPTGEFAGMLQRLKNQKKPYHLAFSKDDLVSSIPAANASKLLALQSGMSREINHFSYWYRIGAHNLIIADQAKQMFQFLRRH